MENEEKVIIKSKPYNVKKTFLGIAIGALVLGIVLYCLKVASIAKYDYHREANSYIEALTYFAFGKSKYGSAFGGYSIFPTTVIPGIVIAIIFVILYFAYSKISITVTNKRVYGNTFFGKQVDLPVDSISAVGSGMMKGISVATSSGKITFSFIKNRDEIRTAITNLLNNRQTKQTVATTTIKQEIPQSNADELKKYKDLLDSGVISQEEFDAKKKQLLGL